jgi:nucleoside-diphosphate-sugar epimerase
MSRLILLTGGTGFVGRQILRALQVLGYQIRLVIREGSQSKLESMHGIEKIVTTPDLFLESSEWWVKVCNGVDVVIHSAWYAEPGKYLQSSKNLECLMGTLSLAKGVIKSKVNKFIGVGTCFEYDLSFGELAESTPLKPTTLYAATKTSSFLTLSQLFENANIDFAWCRLFYLFGEMENEKRLVAYIRKCLSSGVEAHLSSGNQVRDFMDVHDAAKAIVNTALGEQTGPVNICSGTAISVKELALKIAEEYGRHDLLKFSSRPDNLIDPPFVVGVSNIRQ